jgi:hypothetical protein
VWHQSADPDPRPGVGRLVVSSLILSIITALIAAGLATMTSAPANADAGPSGYTDLASEPGFTGWVLSDGRQLGIAKLANGMAGVCFDAGAHPWPSSVITPDTVKNPKVGYLLSLWLPKARDNANVAAALWVVTGLDLGQNSNAGYMRESISRFHSDFPAQAHAMEDVRDQMLSDANKYAAPSTGYTTDTLAVRLGGTTAKGGVGTATGIGTRSAAGSWVPGAHIKLALDGAKWGRNDSSTITIDSSSAAQSLAWYHATPGTVTVTETITGLGNTVFKRQPAVRPGGQRVGFSAGTVSISGTASKDDKGWVKVHKVDGTTGANLPGATFVVFNDLNGNGTRQTNEKQQTLQTGNSGLTPAFVGFANSSICARETVAPSGYVRTKATLCRKITASTTAAAPARITVKNYHQPAQALYPLVVTKTTDATDPGDPAGIIGVTVEVRRDSPTGTFVDAHTFTAADISNGTGRYQFGAKFDENTTYFVVITNEPAGFEPDQTSVQAVLSTDSSGNVVGFGADLLDYKIWTPTLATQISSQIVSPGVTISDHVDVASTGGYTIPGHWRILGPVYPSGPDAAHPCDGIDWTNAPVAAAGDFTITGDAGYEVGDYLVSTTQCFTYQESAEPTDHTAAVDWTTPGIPAETTLSISQPSLSTQVNLQNALPGAVLVDHVTVADTYGQTIAGEWQLRGPIAPDNQGQCTMSLPWDSAPVAAQGTFTATGDGSVDVGQFTVTAKGCFSYQERLSATPTTTELPWTPAGVSSETTLVQGPTPVLSTQVNRQRATAGAYLVDRVYVTGTHGATVTGRWKLLGPIAPTLSGSCRGLDWSTAPTRAHGTFTVHGDGTYTVGRTQATTAGCYTYREQLLASNATSATTWTKPGIVAETSAVKPQQPYVPDHPQIGTGFDGQLPLFGRLAVVAQSVKIAALNMKAALVGSSFTHGELLPPADVSKGGIWSEGAKLNALVGTSVLFGHVSDAHDRPGAFGKLKRAKVGQIVTTVSNGKVRKWKITAINVVDRSRLPRSIFNQAMVRRLVLVTCANKIVHADGTFHYRSNRIVTARPVR